MKTPKDRQRWYQFSFQFLLVLITVAALLCLFWRERALRIEAEMRAQRNAALALESMKEAQDSVAMARRLTLYSSDLKGKVEELQAQIEAIGQPEGKKAGR